jgi:Zn-dependent M28 family amino/carboxypeptidase
MLVVACGVTPQTETDAPTAAPPHFEAAAAAITAAGLRADIATLSDDALEGRGPGTDGDRLAREHIASRLAALGFAPGAPDGTYEQPIEIVGMTAHMPPTWTFRGDGGEATFSWWDEYIAASGVQRPEASFADAEVVFVGYGIEAPEEDWDDYAGIDLTGKVLLMMNNDPDWDPELFGGDRRLYYGRWTYKYEIAAEKGAVAAIVIHTEPSAGYGWNVIQTSWTGPQFELPARDEPRILAPAWLTEDAARRLVALAGHDLEDLTAAARTREFRPVPLGVTTSLDFTTEVESATTANVLGILPGSDPERADEVVVYTAHHDHLGVGEPDADGDRIYNGAVDNASGVAQILAVAEAFARLPEPPARTVMILAVAAEEQGLLGSRYFASHPTVHPGKIAANVNVDGGNVWGRTEDVAVIGEGKSDLEERLSALAALQDREVVGEPDPDKGYYYRSDQLNFAKIGVPALYFKPGNRFRGRPDGWGREVNDRWRREVYHQPSDEISEDWDLSGMVEDARLAFGVGLAVAEADALPRWRPGDEFEEIRANALAAAAGAD